jgi:hypothetical protein
VYEDLEYLSSSDFSISLPMSQAMVGGIVPKARLGALGREAPSNAFGRLLLLLMLVHNALLTTCM